MPVILASIASISGGSVSLRGRSRASARRPARLVTTAAVPSRSGIPDSQRIVITGVGCVTPLGNDPKIFYDNLCQGKSGVKDLVETFPKDGYDALVTKIGAPVMEVETEGYLAPKTARRIDKTHKFAIVAGKKCLEDAGLLGNMEEMDKTKMGILVGSAMGGMTYMEDGVAALKKGKKLSPFVVPYLLNNMSGAILGMEPDVGFRGPNYTINTACATSNYCFIAAANHLKRGEAKVMLAGGTEGSVTPFGLAGFIACKALSSRNDEPAAASRPWDTGRDGFVMGEGAGVLCMETLEHAKARGAKIIAEYLGGGISTDAYDMTAPHPEGRDVILCMETALKDAGVSVDDIDYINAHGTSTPVGDLCEIAAIRSVFGSRDPASLKINSTKSMTGHSLGAAGALEAIAVLKAIETGTIHPTINNDSPEPTIDFDICRNTPVEMAVEVGLSNSFGFGGHNSSVLFGKYNP